MNNHITDDQWRQFEQDGFLKLGKVLSDDDRCAIQERLDDIMLGRAAIDYERMVMQRETGDVQLGEKTGGFGGATTGPQTLGFKGPTLNYRVMYGLEQDPLFLRYIQQPIFEDLCRRQHGHGTPIKSRRAMVMNKPAHSGTALPWHQDFWENFDPQPVLQVWTALDPATIENGCVKVVRGSHLLGLINPTQFLNAEETAEYCTPDTVVYLELAAGEAALLHSMLLHSSETNQTDIPRRGFSECYMDAHTLVSPLTGEHVPQHAQEEEHPVIFGAL